MSLLTTSLLLLLDNLFYQLLVILNLRRELTEPVPGQRVCKTLSLLY